MEAQVVFHFKRPGKDFICVKRKIQCIYFRVIFMCLESQAVIRFNQWRQNFICSTKTEHSQWSALLFFCHSCVFARLYVVFLLEKCLAYFRFISSRPFFNGNRQFICDRRIKALFSCLEMTLSNPIHFNETENYFLMLWK